ncbi:hypothetical protein D3C71_77310 [compost metagenome]
MVPEQIILDTSEVVRKIQEKAKVCDHISYATHGEFFLQTLAGQVIESLRDRRQASLRLHTLVNEVASSMHEDSIPPEFAPLIEELGHVVLRQLDEHKAFNVDGVLPYQYWIPPFKADAEDLMLQRMHGLAKK